MGTAVVNGVTYVNTSGSVKFSDIAAAFGNSYNRLSQMRGLKWYKADFTRGNFASAGSFSLNAVRGTSASIPRVNRTQWPSIGKAFYSGNIQLPSGFNKLLIYVYGNGGGGGGGNGSTAITLSPLNLVTVNGGAGGTGGTSSVTISGVTYSATGGTGGNQGVNGSNGSPDPGARNDAYAGGTGYGSGGKGGIREIPEYNADTNWGAASALFNAIIPASYGASGAGGAGGAGNYTTGANGSSAPNPISAIVVFVDYNLY